MTISKKQKTGYKKGLWATLITGLGCLSTHLLVALGIITLTATVNLIEHALLVGTGLLAVISLYAFIKHRNSDCDHN